jgi:hypothetical protein
LRENIIKCFLLALALDVERRITVQKYYLQLRGRMVQRLETRATRDI